MKAGWRYRIAGVLGTLTISVGVVTLAYEPFVPDLANLIPILQRLSDGMEIVIEASMTAVAVVRRCPNARPSLLRASFLSWSALVVVRRRVGDKAFR